MQRNIRMVDYVVYFIAAVEFDNKVKIGKTNNIKRRLSALQTGSSVRLHVLHLIHLDTKDEMSALEKRIHNLLDYKRLNGEWFNLTKDDTFFVYRKYRSDSTGIGCMREAALRWITVHPPNNNSCLSYYCGYAINNKLNSMTISEFDNFLIQNGYILVSKQGSCMLHIMSAQPTGTVQDPIVISDEDDVSQMTAQLNSLTL